MRLSRRWASGLASLIRCWWWSCWAGGCSTSPLSAANTATWKIYAGLNRQALEEAAKAARCTGIGCRPSAPRKRAAGRRLLRRAGLLSQARAGCWCWPAQRWVVHRGGEQAGAVDGMRALAPAGDTGTQPAGGTIRNDSQGAASNDGQSAVSSDGLLAIELEQISTGQLQVYLQAEQEE